MQIVHVFAAITEYLGTLLLAVMLVGGLVAVWMTSRGPK